MQSSLVIVKNPNDTRQVQVDFSDVFVGGETISAGVITQIDPTTLTAVVLSVTSPLVAIQVSLGTDLQSYGVNVTVNTTGAHTYTKTVAVVINSNLAYDYQTHNVDAFSNLVGELEAGAAGIGSVSFMFPIPFDPAGGHIKWDLLDRDGTVYSSGLAHDYLGTTLSNDVKITGSAVINSPSDMIPTLAGQNYQIRWALVLNGQTYYSFETLVITGPNTTPEGVEDVIELSFNDIPVNVVFDQPYEYVTFEVYKQNILVIPQVSVNSKVKTPDGYLYAGLINSPINMPAALEAYNIVWTGWNQVNQAGKIRETGRIFVVNPSIMSAVNDMRVMINKSATTIAHRKDLLFTPPLLLAYLRRGRDNFNGAQGVFTGFDMTNAAGSIREFWLRYSEVMALRAQFLAEGEKVFNFSGQAISLDVDRTGFYSGLADTLQSAIDAEVKPFKQNLIIKGHINGDGNLGPFNGSNQAIGAAGAVGISLSPATGWGKWNARWGIR
jgi:hypothetical protein